MNYYRLDEGKQLHKGACEIIFEEKENGCHECISHSTDRDGYPRVERFGKQWIMSRYIWTLAHGPIPFKLVVMHKCDHPYCINIDHLELGTQEENMRAMKERGRANHKGKTLSEQEKKEIINSKKTIKQLAKDKSVSHSTVVKLRQKRTARQKIKRAPDKPSMKGTKSKTNLQKIKQSSN
jgi:hypothetical protein